IQLQKPRIDEINQKMMKQNFKPMYVTMIPAIIFYSWLRHVYPQGIDPSMIAVIHLPFNLFDMPILSYLHNGVIPANTMGAIGWYITVVSVISNLIRKILDMA
ncbi:MAG: EMC3/TMCO1 family protein, partial [Candidatus Methanofastidiosia archaeon]